MIKEKRKLKHSTQEQMSEKLGISLRQYVRIDNEKAFPRRDILKMLIYNNGIVKDVTLEKIIAITLLMFLNIKIRSIHLK